MNCLILKLNFVFIILLFCISSHSQNSDSQNTFEIKLNIPVIVDEYIDTKYIPERMTDKHIEYIDKKTYLGERAKGELHYAENSFWGNYENPYFPHEKVSIKGTLSDDQMLIKTIRITRELLTESPGRKEIIKFEVRLRDVPMFNGISFFDKQTSQITITNHVFEIIESRKDYYTQTHIETLKSIDIENIPENPKLARGKIAVDLKMDGPPSYKIITEKIRGNLMDWKSPAVHANPEYFTEESESNSISFAKISTGLDDKWEEMAQALFNATMNNHAYINGKYDLLMNKFHILEREKLQKIKDEVDLGSSGLVAENTKVKAGKLSREEVAVSLKLDPEKSYAEVIVESAKLEKRISVYFVKEENFGFITDKVRKLTWELVLEALASPPSFKIDLYPANEL